MKYGVNTLIWTGGFDLAHLPILPRIKEAGFDGVEIATFQFDGFPAADVCMSLSENRLECTLCSALTGDLSLVSEDAYLRRKALAFLREGIRAAAEIGARIFAGPFYAPVGYLAGRRRTTEEWKRAVESLQSLSDTLSACDVTLALEPLNRFETYFLNTLADAARLCEEVGHPKVVILFDTFHANIEEKTAGEAIRVAGKHIKHVHTCENDRGVPGSGHVDWDGVFQALGDVGYDGWLVIESFGFTIKEIAAAACIWRDLAPTPETIAFEGLKFLRKKAAG